MTRLATFKTSSYLQANGAKQACKGFKVSLHVSGTVPSAVQCSRLRCSCVIWPRGQTARSPGGCSIYKLCSNRAHHSDDTSLIAPQAAKTNEQAAVVEKPAGSKLRSIVLHDM